MLNPDSRLTRTPDFDGTTARFTGTFKTPARNVTPAARASATPTGVTFGPTGVGQGRALAKTDTTSYFKDYVVTPK
jgi:hypothetical protein